jgi:hypothetical protein
MEQSSLLLSNSRGCQGTFPENMQKRHSQETLTFPSLNFTPPFALNFPRRTFLYFSFDSQGK